MASSEDVENQARESRRRDARVRIETIAERHGPKRSLAFALPLQCPEMRRNKNPSSIRAASSRKFAIRAFDALRIEAKSQRRGDQGQFSGEL